MKRQNEFHAALAIVGTALGLDFATGRALSAFYAQLGHASWLGVAAAAAVFGAMMGLLARLARRTGAESLPGLFKRLPGGRSGSAAGVLYALIQALASYMLLSAAAHAGALVLPVQAAGVYGAAFALLLALWIALRGKAALKRAGAAVALLLALFELALLFFAPAPDETHLRFELELRLRDNWGAAILLALLHASACGCISAGAALRLAGGRLRPLKLGLWAGALFGGLLLLGNAALMVRPEQLRALKLPFVALAAGWGNAGFYAAAGMKFLSAAVSLAGLGCGLPIRGLYAEKRC